MERPDVDTVRPIGWAPSAAARDELAPATTLDVVEALTAMPAHRALAAISLVPTRRIPGPYALAVRLTTG